MRDAATATPEPAPRIGVVFDCPSCLKRHRLDDMTADLRAAREDVWRCPCGFVLWAPPRG